MTSQARGLLDALMGPNRNAIKSQSLSHYPASSWDDSSSCGAWLLDICPHELLVNTRVDLGRCSRRHNDLARIKFNQETEYPNFRSNLPVKTARSAARIVLDCAAQLRAQLVRCDRRIDRQTERLRLAQEANQSLISELLKKSENLMETGDLVAAMAIMTQAQEISDHQKKEIVCDVCGAIWDTRGPDTHRVGKQHQAFLKMRAWLHAPPKIEEFRQREDSISSISE
jgi:hypothetical protein